MIRDGRKSTLSFSEGERWLQDLKRWLQDLKTDKVLIRYQIFVVLGAALNISWIPIVGIYIQNYHNGDLRDGSALLSAVVFALGLSVTLLLKTLLAQKGSIHRGDIDLVELCGTSLTGQVLLYLAPGASDASLALVVLGSILTAIGTAGLIFFWQYRFARLDRKRQVFGILVVAAAYICAFLILLYTPRIVSSLFAIIATILCGIIAYFLSLREMVEDATTTKDTNSALFRQKMRFLHIRTCFAFFLVGFPFSLMTFLFSTTPNGSILQYTWVFLFAGIILSGCSLFFGWMRFHEFDFPFSFRIACITVIAAFFPFQVGTPFATQFCFCSDAVSFVTIMIVGALVLIGNDRDLAPLGVSNGSFGWVGFVFGIALGFPASYAILNMGLTYQYVAGIACYVFVLISTVLLFDKETVRSLKIVASQQYPHQMVTPAALPDRVVLTCRKIASDRHLTKRETEVLCILARGNSIAHVKEELFISEGTAITHRRHIYRKLGVHSRQELINLFSPTNMVSESGEPCESPEDR
jgi:DNA-binding CsgD family transcriptional regulator